MKKTTEKNFTRRQQEIINKAATIISRKGIQNLTIKNLSKMIGITEPAIYRHFKNKEEILSNILFFFKQKINKKFNNTDNLLSIQDEKAISILKKFLYEHLTVFLQFPAFSFILFSEEIFQNNKKVFKQIMEIMQEEENTIKKIINEAKARGEIRNDIPPKNITHIILGSIRLLIKKWYFSNFKTDLTSDFKSLWNSLLIIITKKQ